ncbi:glycosyltransferase [Mucilaginibacter roseus]|uniref:Glycosyltransferase n=1 Tax=Mucilaginibacter roseus TaxID=1528868 RepID=A0ABS8U0U2_9SPHI|nr:glycosyltransferase [Mucilaginibacter roseus]MCD8740719.1 glycosyltransferase [Mucilaginibacter roseus]
MKNNISLLVGLKNNLDYSKNFYHTTRAIYPEVEIVFVSYGSTDGTHEWLDGLNDPYLVYHYSAEQKTFSDTFNKCTELATKDYVAYAHNDMILAPGFIESLEQLIAEDTVITYTTIEPPIFAGHERPGKIIKDFGDNIENQNIAYLYSFVRELQQTNNVNGEPSDLTFFLCVFRKVLLEIGGLDPLYNPMFCEDDDLILRLKLLGLKTIVSHNAICYHFVSKTSRSSDEYKDRTKLIEENSNRNFTRKWGFLNSSPIKHKYNLGFILKNGTDDLLRKIEPFCTSVYTDHDANGYILSEQPNTAFDLNTRIKPLQAEKNNDMLVNIDGSRFTDDSYNAIRYLNEIITRRANKKLGFFEKLIGKSNFKFKRANLTIEIKQLRNLEHTLINRR